MLRNSIAFILHPAHDDRKTKKPRRGEPGGADLTMKACR